MPKKTRSTRSSDQDGRDYCGIALAYAKRAADEKNRARFGKWIRLAARRYIRDLDRAGKRGGPFHFDRDEAVRRILSSRGEFVVDTSREKHGLSFNLGGYLRRVR